MKAKLVKKAICFFHRMKRPVLLGEVSLWIDAQLDRTEEVLDVLVDDKHIHKMTSEEMKSQGLGDRNYYIVIGEYDIKLASTSED
jgi:hypothetical protein